MVALVTGPPPNDSDVTRRIKCTQITQAVITGGATRLVVGIPWKGSGRVLEGDMCTAAKDGASGEESQGFWEQHSLPIQLHLPVPSPGRDFGLENVLLHSPVGLRA